MDATSLIDDLATAAHWAVQDEIAACYAEAKCQVAQDAQEASDWLNEREALVHKRFFEQYDQWLFPAYGDRRNGGEGLGPWCSRHVREMLSPGWNGWRRKLLPKAQVQRELMGEHSWIERPG
ncbi:hypothetical protein SAMN06265337_0650 [Hymenobacter gelipurpurascens]|uniref:Uncharacterized protein n=1 Tax=Hymenobacter gelipurpurascens TaxID=89968 RepID=A0A212T8J6_9BACT|nr:hypothetical protein [Hymenobacter gelipurpurascens]SNC62339.1 hypothetical protein SAMN06265337_0650 [Hymenobacter gelipurpurascens]